MLASISKLLMVRPSPEPIMLAKTSKNKVSSLTQLMFIAAPGLIPALSTTLVLSEVTCLRTTVVFRSLNRVLSRNLETSAALARTTMLPQLVTAIAQSGQKVQLSMPSLITLSTRISGLEISKEHGGSLPRMATKISNASAIWIEDARDNSEIDSKGNRDKIPEPEIQIQEPQDQVEEEVEEVEEAEEEIYSSFESMKSKTQNISRL